MSDKNKILLHACCGICSGEPISRLKAMGYTPIVYFCNPNLSSKEEFDKRDYTYIKNNRTEKKFTTTPIVHEDEIDTIHLGNIVKVLDMDFDEEIEYELVETSEIDLTQNKISIE